MCRFFFEQQPERYASHKDVVKRVLSGEAPGNLMAFLKHSGLSFSDWGKDTYAGEYAWVARAEAQPSGDPKGG
jgi:hypothetical protein